MIVRVAALLALALGGSPAAGTPSTASEPFTGLDALRSRPSSGRTAGGVRAGSAGAPSAGAPAPSPELRDQVIPYLGAIDRPVSPETWRALGPAAEPVLLEVAGSSAELPTRRTRALEGLAALGGARAAQVHLRLARELGRAAAGAQRRGARPRAAARPGAPRRRGPPAPRGRAPSASGASPREVLARHAPAEACADVRALAAREPGPARWSRALSACDWAAAPRER